jgi:hypothetical protein
MGKYPEYPKLLKEYSDLPLSIRMMVDKEK